MTQLTTILTGLVQLSNSDSGNPRFEVFTDKGTFKTNPDSDCNYGIQNANAGTKLQLTLDKLNRITHVEIPNG